MQKGFERRFLVLVVLYLLTWVVISQYVCFITIKPHIYDLFTFLNVCFNLVKRINKKGILQEVEKKRFWETPIWFDCLRLHPAVSNLRVFASITWNSFLTFPDPTIFFSSLKLRLLQHPVQTSTHNLLHWNYMFTCLLPSRANIFKNKRHLLISPLITSCIIIYTLHICILSKSSSL